jgi:hypothetical protein
MDVNVLYVVNPEMNSTIGVKIVKNAPNVAKPEIKSMNGLVVDVQNV